MALTDTTTNLNAVLNKLVDQIDRRIGLLEDNHNHVGNSPIAMVDTVAFLKHIRLVLGGPLVPSNAPANVTHIRDTRIKPTPLTILIGDAHNHA